MTERRMQTVKGWDPTRDAAVSVRIAGETIVAVEPLGTADRRSLPLVVPGLVDLQVNGFAGHDVNGADATVEDVVAITRELAARGVTSWVPTIITAAEDAIHDALRRVEHARQLDPQTAASVQAVHVEGPFISDQDGPRGVHDAEHVRPMDADEVIRWQRTSDLLAYVTVSPHDAASPEHIRRIVGTGVRVAIGHTHASPVQLRAAIEAGADLATHLGNGIATMLPRHPNALWTLLADDRVQAGLIADGHHLPTDTLTVMLRALGPERAFVVSDSTALAGSPPGRYRTAVGGEVEVSGDGRLSYVGTELLAGSGVSLADCLAHLVGGLHLPVAQAVSLVTRNPARLLPSRAGRRGVLEAGARADVILIDESGRVLG